MAYRVELAKIAEVQPEELYLWLVERAPSQGTAWFNGLEQAFFSLEQLPTRYRIAPESFDPDQPVRVLNYGRSPHARLRDPVGVPFGLELFLTATPEPDTC